MNIAIVCPNYKQGRSYQENIWAEQLALMGHRARVILAGRVTAPPQTHRVESATYETQEVATRFLPRSTYHSAHAHLALREFQPHLIVVHGDKLFALGIARDRKLARVPLISTYSENLGMHEFDWRKRGISLRQRLWALAFATLRGRPIRELCRRSALIVGNTPQARGILLRLFRSERERREIDGKILDMPLGFDPRQFGFKPDLRQTVRRELGAADDEILICASSHFHPSKEPYIALIVDAFRNTIEDRPRVRGVVVGFTEEPEFAEVSRRIDERIRSGAGAERFVRHPFANRARLAQLYSAADIAVFGRVSISCQEALGSGLVACFADDGSMRHLVSRPDQAVFFKPGDAVDLARAMGEAAARFEGKSPAQRESFHRELADAARWLGYDRIIASILADERVRAALAIRDSLTAR